MDLTFTTNRGAFNVRVGAVVIDAGRLLLQGDRRCSFLVPPGGRCTLHEASRAAAARELREELGRDVTIGRLLWVIESFFDLNGVAVHELGFLYEAHLPARDPLPAARGQFAGAEPEPAIYFQWVPLADLGALEVHPHVLRTLPRVPATTEHIVIDQRRG